MGNEDPTHIFGIVDKNGGIVVSAEAQKLLHPGAQLRISVLLAAEEIGKLADESSLTEGAKFLQKLKSEGLIGFIAPHSDDFPEKLREAASRGDTEELERLRKE
jgi:hypothetical protein